MSFYALITGLVVISYVIVRFKHKRWEKTKWAYPLFLASFPFFYFAFAVYANDITALGAEVLSGTIFFLLAYIAYKSQLKLSALLVGFGCVLHAAYDYYHDTFFINAGTPSWWIEFCGSIDLILGLYLIYFAINAPGKVLNQDAETTRT